jgi:uncharacterized membrane protein YbaN (DUF454 family)
MVRKVVSMVLGVLLIIVGIIGLFLPIIQGIACIVAGLALVGYASPRVKRKLEPLVRRCETYAKELGARASRWMRRK